MRPFDTTQEWDVKARRMNMNPNTVIPADISPLRDLAILQAKTGKSLVFFDEKLEIPNPNL